MNWFPRDILFSIRAPGTLVAIVLLVLGGALISEVFVADQPAPLANYSIDVEYANASGYRLTFFVFNSAGGGGIGDASINLLVSGPGSPGPVLLNRTEWTDSEGFAVFSWPGPEGSSLNGTAETATLHIVTPYGSTRSLFSLPTPTPGVPLGVGTVHLVSVGDFVVTPYIQVSFGDPNGTVPPGLRLVYSFPANNGTVNGSLGSVTTDPEQFRLRLPASAMNAGGVPVDVALVNETGGFVDGNTFGSTEFLVESGSQTPEGGALASAETYLSLLIPLGAVIIGEVAYGRDRISGALEPLLALPLTRVGVLLRRYSSSIVILGAGVTAALGVFEWQAVDHSISIPGMLALGLWVSMILEGSVFLSLMFLFSHVFRSQGTLVASGISVVLVYGALWTLLVLLAATFAKIPRQIYSQAIWEAHIGFANPVSLAQGILALSLWQLNPSSSLLFPADTNLALESGVVLAWLVLPLIGAILLAKHRD